MTEEKKKCMCSIAHNWWHCPTLGNNWKGFLMRLVMCDMTLSDKDWVQSNDPDRGLNGLRPPRFPRLRVFFIGLGLFCFGVIALLLQACAGRWRKGEDTWLTEDDDPHGRGDAS